MDAATLHALAEADEIELVTIGRTSGRPHTVRLRFAYADGVVWLRTGERPPEPDASGVRRRTGVDRAPDWLRNLERDPHARLRLGDIQIAVRYEPPHDQGSDLRHAVELLRAKYGAEWVADWYVDMGRIPVKLRIQPALSQG